MKRPWLHSNQPREQEHPCQTWGRSLLLCRKKLLPLRKNCKNHHERNNCNIIEQIKLPDDDSEDDEVQGQYDV